MIPLYFSESKNRIKLTNSTMKEASDERDERETKPMHKNKATKQRPETAQNDSCIHNIRVGFSHFYNC